MVTPSTPKPLIVEAFWEAALMVASWFPSAEISETLLSLIRRFSVYVPALTITSVPFVALLRAA